MLIILEYTIHIYQFYWCLNPNSADTGGLLEDDWLTPTPRKINLTNRAQPNPTKFQPQNG